MPKCALPENPAWARVFLRPASKAGGFLCEWKGSTVGVFHNTTERIQKLDLADAGVEFRKTAAWISADPLDGGASLDGTVLTLGPLTSAVLRTEAE